MLQWRYALPDIYIVQSSNEHYHAYCFACRELKEVINILSSTQYICEDFLRLGMIRGYYTLRISQRNTEVFTIVKVLQSEYPDEMFPSEVTLNDYITYNRGNKNA